MEISTPTPKDILKFQIERNIKSLFRSFLIIMEDLNSEQDNSMLLLKKNLPEHQKIIDQSNILNDHKLEYLRKKILDAGNNCIRSVETDMNIFDIDLNIERK